MDCHEGHGQGFYLYKPEVTDRLTEDVVDALISEIEGQGGHTLTPEEFQPHLAHRLDETELPLRLEHSIGLCEILQQQAAISLTFETGGLSPVKWRTDLHVWAALSAIRYWERKSTVMSRCPAS
jgi:hypothetical protein